MARQREREERKQKRDDTTPIFTGNVGRVVYSCWEREGDYGPMLSVKFQRMYRDPKDETQYTDGFDASDLGNLVIAAMTVAQRCARLKMDARNDDDSDTEPESEPAEKPAKAKGKRGHSESEIPY